MNSLENYVILPSCFLTPFTQETSTYLPLDLNLAFM